MDRIRNVVLLIVLAVAIALALTLLAKGTLFLDVLPEDGATFLYFPVGQANCAVIRSAEGNVMIDTGAIASEEDLLSLLSYYEIDTVDLLILTHADEDHTGGLTVLLREISVKRIMMTAGAYETLMATRTGRQLERALESGETAVETAETGTETAVGEIFILVLAPPHESEEIGQGDNASSLITYIRYGDTEAIFPGDADFLGEERAVSVLEARFPDADCDLLSVGHHGSKTSSSDVFLSYLSPKYAIISCGLDNSYGHPSVDVLDRLSAVGATVCRTDLEGTVIFHTDGTVLTRLR